MIYTIGAIQSHPEVGLSRGGLVLIALLCGGDYHKVCCNDMGRWHMVLINPLFIRVSKSSVRSSRMPWLVVGSVISC